MSSIKNIWLKDEKFARNIPRQIDDETIIDLLAIIEFETDKHILLEDAGYHVKGSAYECLFDYILDALKVPAETDTFSREAFEIIFYSDYLLEKKYTDHTEVLNALKQLSKETNERLAQANVLRATFRTVESPKL